MKGSSNLNRRVIKSVVATLAWPSPGIHSIRDKTESDKPQTQETSQPEQVYSLGVLFVHSRHNVAHIPQKVNVYTTSQGNAVSVIILQGDVATLCNNRARTTTQTDSAHPGIA